MWKEQEGCGYGNGSRIFLADVGQNWEKKKEEEKEKEILQIFVTVFCNSNANF